LFQSEWKWVHYHRSSPLLSSNDWEEQVQGEKEDGEKVHEEQEQNRKHFDRRVRVDVLQDKRPRKMEATNF